MKLSHFRFSLGLAAVIAVSLTLSFGGGAGATSAKNNDNNDSAAKNIPGQYIVVLKDEVTDANGAANDLVKIYKLVHLQTYKKALKGFAANFNSAQLAALERDSRVDYVVEDRKVEMLAKPGPVQPLAQTVPTGVRRINAPAAASTGAGIGVAVIDTGIDLTHPDLKANLAAQGRNCINSKKNANDDNGHGTHVAGTIAAVNNGSGVVGAAPQAKLFAVKVLDRNGSGSWSSVICGIDWVTANAGALGIKVANISLGGGGGSDNNCGFTDRDVLHQAICRSVAAGVTYVVAAGNSNQNTSLSVPASYDDAVITVSALADSDGNPGGTGGATPYGADDTFASFSNFGSAVDLGAPGVSIFSTYKGGAYATLSGTSMAAPHVSGAAALYLQSHPGSSWTQVRDDLKALGEPLGGGHTDPSGKHPEPVLEAGSL